MCEVPDLGEGHGVVNLTTITGAAYRIRNGIEKTACEKLAPFTEIEDYDVFVKREYLQPTGSFKVRGARNALLTLTPEQKGRGVITTSAGNHGLALAQQGDELGIPVMVLLPENVSPLKVKLCNRYNATTKLAGRNATEVRNMAIKFESEGGCGPIYIDENENTHVISGQGTMGLEIVDQVEDVDAIIVPVGGGGLLAGISVAVKTLYPDIQIIGVEAAACPSFQAAMSAGKPVKVKAEMWLTLAEGEYLALMITRVQLSHTPCPLCFAVREEHIALAVLRLLEKERIIIEGSGAAGLAALIGGYLPELKGKRVVVPLCGGNIESTTLGRAIERGLYADHRMVRFVVRIGDRPGALARLLHTISSIGASVKDLYQERTWLNSSVYNIQVKVVAELRNAAHGKELRSMLLHRYHEDLQWNTTNDEG
ncbi:predicted protein [Nematostella vectensis]|uniref:Serine racemase n=1 Tax=Nematostella vectensis TaxID=45351 RepID=A7RTQ8_NEMVE|nr:predicted protein [Nematostella vectensis]|eukprot:XP_001637133.1 predicted protein [Nematostella vectensis]